MAGPLRAPGPAGHPLSPQRAPLADALGGAALLLASGAALGLGLASQFFVADGAAFVTANRAPEGTRAQLLAGALLAALAFAAGPLASWLRGGLSSTRLREIGLRLSPGLPIGLAFGLLDASAWAEARLTHAVAASLVGAIAFACVRARAAATPLALERRLAARLRPGQERLAAMPPALPLLLVAVAAVAYALWFSHLTLQAHWNGHSRSYDLAIFDNLHWNLLFGEGFLRATPAGGGEPSHFGRHATLLAYALAPFYALHPSAATLLVLQSVLIGAAALPLFAFARLHLGAWPACALALAYLLYAPLHGSNLADFHFLSISPFFLFSTAWALEGRSRRGLALAVLLSLSVREDVALGVAVLGAYHVLANRRVRAGLVLAALGLGWFGVMKFVCMPLVVGGSAYADIYQGLVPAGASGFGAVLETLVVNPGFALGTLLRAEKLEYALLVLAPVAFLPLRRLRLWIFLAPGVLFTLLSTDYAPTVSIGFQYTAFWSPYVFLAVALALRADAFAAPDGAATRRAWASAAVLLTGLCSYQYGAVFQQGTAVGGFHDPYPLTTTAADLERRRLRAEVLAALPARASVAASESVAPHVSNRAVAYTLREGVLDAEYVVFGLVPEAPGEHAVVRALLQAGGYGVVAANEAYALLRRGEPETLNRRLLEQMASAAARAR